jgi:hypothetical protein
MKYLKFFEGFDNYEKDEILDSFLSILDEYQIPVLTNSELVLLIQNGIDDPNIKYCTYFKNLFSDYVIDIKCGMNNLENFKSDLTGVVNRLKKSNLHIYTEWAINKSYIDCAKVLISDNEKSKSFNEKLLPYDINNTYNRISLYKVADKIYSVIVEDRSLRAFLFLRFQEYYESSSSEFQNRNFKWDRYIQWYKSSEGPHGEKDIFTYGDDWTGFNLPSQAIENCLSGIEDHNKYDDMMISIMKSIREDESGNFYLIAVDNLDINNDLLDHELAHGFYYTDVDYRNRMNSIINQMPREEVIGISNVIIGMGYNKSVLNDEIQAYMSTGIADDMSESLSKYTSHFEREFKLAKAKHKMSPIKMKISFNEN